MSTAVPEPTGPRPEPDGSRPEPDGSRMECGVCWHVYDPAEGDDAWQIPPGVPFTALPDSWRCPHCDAPASGFLRLDG